jgi:hypothetical protein
MVSGSRSLLTEKQLEQERRSGQFHREQEREDAVNSIIITVIKVLAFGFVVFCFSCLAIYIVWLCNHTFVDHDSIETINTLFTHLSAITGGYLAHIVKNSIGRKDEKQG